jgi:D-xylose transport system substrate-binding protein
MSCSHSQPKIGFLIRTYTMERCVKERDYFSQRAKELGAEVVVADANNNDMLQITQGSEMLKNGVDVLVLFAVNGQTAGAIVREAKKYGVPVIAYESMVDNCPLDYFVTFDNAKGGEMMTDYVTKLKPTGNYILLGGDKADKNAILIKQGQHKILDPLVSKGNVKVDYDVYADWTAEEGYYETNRFLDLAVKTPDVILSSNDGLAEGVIKALEERGLAGQIIVTGLDGNLSALQLVAQGKQTVTIFKSLKKEAYTAAEMAVTLSQGKKPNNAQTLVNNKMVDVHSCLLQPVLITRDNLRETIVKEGIYTEQEIYK